MSTRPPTVSPDFTAPRGKLTRLRKYLIAASVWTVVFAVLPSEAHGLWYSVFGWLTVGVVYSAVRRLPEDVRRPALIVTFAGALSLLGGIVRTVDGLVREQDYPFPSVADGFSFVSVLLFLTAVLMIVHRRVRHFTLDPVIDAVIGGVAVALLQWSLVLIPYLRSGDATFGQRMTNILYAAFSLMLIIAAILALVSGSHRSTSNRFLAAGLCCTFVLDVVATSVTAGNLPEQARLYVAPFVFVFGAVGLLHPSVTLLTKRPSDPTMLRRLTSRRILILAIALLTPPVVLVIGLVRSDSGTLGLATAASLTLAPLVVTRLGRLVRANEDLAALEASLRSVGERLVSSETAQEVASVVTVGAEQTLGSNFHAGALVLEPCVPHSTGTPDEVGHLVRQLCGRIPSGSALVTGQLLALPTDRSDRIAVAGLVVVQRELVAALVLVTKKALSDDEHNAVVALCRESAIALRAVEQTEKLVRQRSEDRFAALVDNSSDIVAVLNRALELTYVSPVAQRLLGYPLDALQSTSLMRLVHDEDEPAAVTMLEDIRFGHRASTELRLRHVTGTYHWFEMVGVDLSSDPNIGGIVLNAREITDRKHAEERLVLSEARFKALVQHSTDLVIVLNGEQQVRYASPSVREVMGQTPDEVGGRHVREVFPDCDLDWSSALDVGAQPSSSNGPRLYEFTFQNAAQQWRTIETTITDLRSEPAVEGFVLNARDITERKNMEQRLRYQATHDELTGLANRVHVLDDLTGMLGRNSGSTTVAAILIGVDNFKEINDSLGHAAGDQLLIAVAARITGMLGFGDIAARVGGDEYVVVLERAHGENHVTDLAEQILTAIASPYTIEERELTITASAGIVFDHDRTNTAEILLRNADIAMYRAKTLGKRQVVVFEPHMHADSFDRLQLRADLARAVESEQFVAHYQPVVDIATRRVVGAEALIRWHHPERGMLGPNLFIPLAEETGMIGALGEWILERACRDLVSWRSAFGEPMMDFTMSVNLSVQQLHDDGIVGAVSDILARTGLPAERLVLEVTESTLITDTDRIRATMQDLRQLGARLAVDDFGTGYSSLGYIQQFEFDVLKIDKSFVDTLETHTNQRIVTAVLELARQLDVRTIAEGIETELQAGLLEDLGCTYGQGYLYSRPVDASSFSELLVANRSESVGRSRL
jgi:diguanylate cyclase (GGDEF)-like protein/PAS domain S-box-containing protein